MIQNKAGLWAQGQRAPQGGRQKGQYPKRKPREKGKNKHYKCGEEGHFKRKYPNWKKEEQVIPLTLFNED
jgi:hypothetical protein